MRAISGQSQEFQNEGVEIGFKEALKMRTFLYLNLIEAVRMMTLMAVFTYVMPYLSSVGMQRATASLVAGKNLKGSTVTARACLMDACLINAGGL